MQHNVSVTDLLSVKKIPLSMDSVFSQNDIDQCSHLKGIPLPNCVNNDEIDLLIGSGVPKAFHQFEQRKGDENDIYAVKLTLGWDLVGPKGGAKDSFCAILSENERHENVYLIGDTLSHSCNDISKGLSKIFDQDFNDCTLFDYKIGPSVEDEYAIKLVEKSITINNDKFYVGIPWAQNPSNLPSNREIVLKRLNGLKRRFERDEELRKSYSNEMQKLIDNEFIEPSNSEDTELCHFIPHHPVWHPRKKSIRIVWDCAVSLNDFIYEGPNLLNELTNVLIRFRRYNYAVTSDIRKMYLNVKVPCYDRGGS